MIPRIALAIIALLCTTTLLAQQPDPYEMQLRMQQQMEDMMRRMERGFSQDSLPGGSMQFYWSTPDTTITKFFGPNVGSGFMEMDSFFRTMPEMGLWSEELFNMPNPEGGLSPLRRRDMDARIEELLEEWREQLRQRQPEEKDGRRIYRL